MTDQGTKRSKRHPLVNGQGEEMTDYVVSLFIETRK